MDNQQHIGVLHIATAGQNGLNLGSDEEEIVMIQIGVVDWKGELLTTFSSPVRPSTFDENGLSEECKATGLTEEMVAKAKGLDQVLGELHPLLTPYPTLVLLAESPLPLRQSLHPEACAKDLKLEKYFWSFYDLSCELGRVGVDVGDLDYGGGMAALAIPDDQNSKFDQMLKITQHLIRNGHVFGEVERIQEKLEPGICSRSEEIDPNTIVRARGLPWQSSDQDIARFFRGLNIAKGGVALCLSPQGRRNGEALIRFSSESHREMALRRHKHHIGQRYIEVYKATGEDFLAVAGGTNTEAQAFLIKGAAVIVRMRGLPYDCTAKQVLDFFSTPPSAISVLDAEEGVLFVRRPDGRATGDAFVLFKNEEDAAPALAKHRESIGARYIELFRSTTAEVQQVLNRCLDLLPPKDPLPLAPPPPAAVVQHMITAGTRKDCIRLRGLPYEAQVEHILEFLGEHAKNIIYQGVHMVYNAQGQPSGEAFIQMDSEVSAYAAATSSHHRYMIYFKKHRYIEVFQCSGEDMSCVLTGGGGKFAGQQQQQQVSQPILQHFTPFQQSRFGQFQQIFYYSPSPIYPNFLHHQQPQPQQLDPHHHPLTINCNGTPGKFRFLQQQSPGEKMYQKNYLELFMA